MNCPICGGANAEHIKTTLDGMNIDCPACGEYAISSETLATKQWQRLEPEQRRDALDQAKRSAQPGDRPTITTYLLA
jgi:transcription elongation factor Elf1